MELFTLTLTLSLKGEGTFRDSERWAFILDSNQVQAYRSRNRTARTTFGPQLSHPLLVFKVAHSER